jgi:hypothetical protein
MPRPGRTNFTIGALNLGRLIDERLMLGLLEPDECLRRRGERFCKAAASCRSSSAVAYRISTRRAVPTIVPATHKKRGSRADGSRVVGLGSR